MTVTAPTWSSRLRVRFHSANTDWIEKCLAHEQKGVRAVYSKAEYRDQRQAVLQGWADMIDEWTISKARFKE